MTRQRQFSLAYLLAEVGVFAAGMGFTRLAFDLLYAEPFEATYGLFAAAFSIAASIAWGTAIGGFFGKMLDGALWGFLLFPLYFLLMRAVMH